MSFLAEVEDGTNTDWNEYLILRVITDSINVDQVAKDACAAAAECVSRSLNALS